MSEKIFVSYSRSDGDFALRLARDLRERDVPVWIDQIDIAVGDPWDHSVETALRECARLLLILSPASVASRAVLDEVSFALDQGKPVLPVLHRPCEIPFRLRRLQHVDFSTGYAAGLDRLSRALGSKVDPLPPAPPLPDRDVEKDRGVSRKLPLLAAGALLVAIVVAGGRWAAKRVIDKGIPADAADAVQVSDASLAGVDADTAEGAASAAQASGWEPARDLGGDPLKSAASAVSNGRNAVDVFYQGANDHLITRWLDGNGRWSDPADLGGVALSSAPSVITGGRNPLDVFYRGPNGHLWTSWWDGGQWWSAPTDLGGVELRSAPAAVSGGQHRIDVFYAGPNRHLWTSWFDGQWSEPADLGGLELDSAPSAVSRGPKRLDVFYRCPDNHLWTSWWDGGQWWSAPFDLGIEMAGNPSAVRAGDALEVFYSGTDGRLWKVSGAGGESWNEPVAVTVAAVTDPAALSSERVFFRGGNSRLWEVARSR
jgi:hypothetical protein